MLALGLLEHPQNKRAIGLPRRTEVLHRFLLSQLDKEAKEPALPIAPAPASQVATSALCLYCVCTVPTTSKYCLRVRWPLEG